MTPDTGQGLTAQAVADLVGGRLFGDGGVVLRRVGGLEGAGPETLAFLVSPRYRPYFRSSRAGAVLLTAALAGEEGGPSTRIVVDDPQRAVLLVLPRLHPAETPLRGVDPTARIGRGARLGAETGIGAHAVVGEGARIGDGTVLEAGAYVGPGVTIGRACRIGPGAVCYPGTVVGDRVEIKAACILGGTGFGYVPGPEGHQRIPHVGRCVVEDDVHIGSHTCVDRGSLDDTVVGSGTRIDNLVHIAHNVRIGKRCLIMATCAVAGSARVGDDVILAGAAGVKDHVTVGDRARISARSVVMSDVPPGETWGGYPARGHREWLRAQAALYRMPDLLRSLQSLIEEQTRRGQNND